MTHRTPFNPDDALARVKDGGELSEEEIKAITDALLAPASSFDRYTLIHILGRAELVEARPIVERYLDSPDDPMLARIALQVLCDWWGLTEEYLDRLESFAAGVGWDFANEVRQMAVILLGRYLRCHTGDEYLRLLLNTARDEEEDQMAREDAIRALAVALGYDDREMPSAARTESVDSVWSHAVIDAVVRQLEAREE